MFGKLSDDHGSRESQMRQLLIGKGMEVPEDIEEGIRLYRSGCATRALLAAQARRREALEKQLVSRKQVEDAAASIQLQRDNAKHGLLSAAVLCEIPADEELPLSESLLEWLSATSKTIRKHQEASEQWRELDTFGRPHAPGVQREGATTSGNALIAGSAFSGDELRDAMMSFDKPKRECRS